jgi:regulator of telomere elongation helicase 1
MARGVIIVGLPFQNFKEPKVRLKMDYMNEKYKEMKEKRRNLMKEINVTDDSAAPIRQLDGNGWYTLEMMRTVNQSVGRVIRHMNDYGSILLLDERFFFFY